MDSAQLLVSRAMPPMPSSTQLFKAEVDKQSHLFEAIERITSEKAVVVFSSSSCFLCHAVKRLFSSLGVHPAIYELDQQSNGPEIEKALQKLSGKGQVVPSIFVGKRYVGGLDQLIGAHICGALVPQLKEAGALWL